jgi:hypothetical protein
MVFKVDLQPKRIEAMQRQGGTRHGVGENSLVERENGRVQDHRFDLQCGLTCAGGLRPH